MVHETVWKTEAGANSGYLCVGCLERRIGRRLGPEDFTEYPINTWWLPDHTDRLRNRLTGGDPRAEDYLLEEERRLSWQRLEALEKANGHRVAVARERRKIAALPYREGREALAELVETATDPALLSGRLDLYLRAIRGIGPGRVNEILASVRVTRADKRLRDLTERQRGVIAGELRRQA